MNQPLDLSEPAGVVAPEHWGRGKPWRHGALSGRCYGPLPPELAASVARWLESGPTDELVPLKPPSIFRRGDLVVKFFPRISALDRLRTARAARVAELHFRCLPIPSPRPLLAAAAGRGPPSLLLREFLDGALLSTAWRADEHAARELVPFLWRMHAHGILHGDLHPNNLIWTRNEWWLLDVEGVRHRLHSAARVVAGQWARLLAHLDDEPGLERAHRAYHALARGSSRPLPVDAWAHIRAKADRLARQFREPPAGGARP